MQPDQTIEPDQWTEPRPESDGLIPSISVEALLARRDAVASRVALLLTTLTEIGSLLEPIPHASYETRLMVAASHRAFDGKDDVDLMVRSIDACIWDHLLKKSGLWQLMDDTARSEWKKKTSHAEVPELTRANIDATFAELHRGRADMFERGVVAVFRRLSWDYKTNSPVAFGHRLVLTGVVRTWTHRGVTTVYGPSFDGCAQLDDLLRVMVTCDGEPEPATSACSILDRADWPKKQKTAELHGIVRVTGFKNGNAHLTFLREDLVERMNKIVAKHFPNVLPPAT